MANAEPATVEEPLAATIWARFTAVAKEHSARQAIAWPGGAWSYAELRERSELLAGRFGLTERTAPVALYMPRGPELVAAVLAAARLGRPWCILPTRAPLSVTRETLEALGECDLACGEAHALQESLAAGLPVRLVSNSPVDSCPAANAAPGSPAGICFTSGSTGVPKGVVLLQGSTVWNAHGSNALLGIGPEDRYLWLTAAGSAATYPALFGTLLHGACLLPFEVAERGFSELAAWIAESRATIFHSIPSVFRRFAREARELSPLDSLRMVKLGGEPLFAADVRLFCERFAARTQLVNGLGMAETNGILCHGLIRPEEGFEGTATVGRALPGFELSLWDAQGREVTAPGQAGRLRITSGALALGYWNGEQAMPFPTAEGPDSARVFTSEDRCVLLKDGQFAHAGRGDGVVKIRGVGVSLAVIEGRLREMPGIAEAAVEPAESEDGEARIAAWAQPLPGAALEPADIRRHLARTLVPEAIPEQVHVTERIPLLPGGKLDRKALHALARVDSGASTLAPARAGTASPSPAAGMAALFARVLGRPGFGVDEDFFAAGGNSLAAATLAAGVEAEWGCTLHPVDLVENPTPARLIAALGTKAPHPAFRLASGKAGAPPLWLVGGAGDSMFHLLPLARALNSGLGPVYGFEAGLDEAGGCAARLEQMTEPMFRALREVQPAGPYFLAGTSFGGWLAFDLAQRLHKAGEKVAFLGMLDAFGPGYPRLAPDIAWPLRKQQFFLVMLRRYILGLDDRGIPLRRTRILLRRAKTLFRLYLRPKALPRDPLRRSWLLEEACLRARRHYHFEVYPGPITVFPAESRLPGAYREDPALGWGAYSTMPIRSIPVTGVHGVHVLEPHVRGLAGVLLEQIRTALE